MNNLIRRQENTPFFDFAKRFFDNDFDYVPFFGRNNGTGLSNILEKENEYQVELSAPGFKKDDIKIELENDMMKISSSVEDNKEETNEGFYRREFYKSSFERSFTIPKNANKEEISATLIDGILKVSIPKLKKEEIKENIKIQIK